MKIYPVYPAGFASTSYIVTADDENCIVIDCAQPRVLSECRRLNLNPVAVLLTHGHYDHIAGCGALYSAGAKIYCGVREDVYIYSDENMAIFNLPIPEFKIERTFKDGEEIELAGLKIKVISTPGHTVGGVCYLIEDVLFTGDTLFNLCIGRCDSPSGDEVKLKSSVKKLYALAGDYKVYAGHGKETTLDFERKHNPFVRA